MLYWLTLVVVAASALLAQGTTIAAWRARSANPRAVSLALSSAACVAIVVAAADLPLPLPSGLCEQDLERGDVAKGLQPGLESWRWGLLPCARLKVKVGPEDLAMPLDFARLAAIAVENGVVVDVTLEPGIPSAMQSLRLEIRRQCRKDVCTVPIGTPIPASYMDAVFPQITTSTAPECRLDRKGEFEAESLHRLLKATPTATALGFHLLECQDAGDPEALISAYVQIAAAPVVIATSEAALAREPDRAQFSGTHRAASFGLDLVEVTREEGAPEAPSMLVLDRPESQESCELARELLERGGTVVVAMPDAEFAEACADLLPVAPASSRGHMAFDRRPRVTYVLDDFARDVQDTPSAVFRRDSTVDACEPQSRSAQELISLQLKPARSHCEGLKTWVPDVNCGATLTRVTARSDDFVPALLFDREQGFRPQDDAARLRRSAPVAALDDLARAWEGTRVLWENELIVVFTHDLRTRPEGQLDEFLNGLGARVQIVEVEDPYGMSLSNVIDPGAREIAEIEATTLLHEGGTSRLGQSLQNCDGPCCVRKRGTFEASIFDPDAQTKAERSPHPGWGRFAAHDPVGSPTSAPVRFGWWKLPDPQQRRPAPLDLAKTTVDAGLIERPLAVGTMVGPGHLLFLAYSPFDSSDDDAKWRGSLDPGSGVLGGLAAIEELYVATEDLLANRSGPVRSAVLQTDGAVWVTVHRDTVAPELETLMFKDAGGGGTIAAPLVEFDLARRMFTYAIPAAELEERSACTPLVPELEADTEGQISQIYACPPDHHEGAASRMDAVAALTQLAHYTGGTVTRAEGGEAEERASAADLLYTRTLGLGALSLVLLLAWGRRAKRRISGVSAYRRIKRIDQIAQRRYDPPDSVIAAAGDWDGRTSTWPRMGAFGGYRPLEPGDRTSAMLLHDLVIREQEGTELLPRVALRIEEGAPSVLVLVNLGESMRVPERAESGKALFSGRVGLHIAASAWRIRGEVSIHATGLRGDSEIIAPTCVSPGHEELDQNLRARLRQRPARDSTPWPDALPECGAVVYVSDFQLEDEGALQTWLTELEGAGIRVGGVMVHDPVEFTMIEGGRLAGSGVWADRADWDPDDVFEAFSRRRDQIERIFDAATTGGLVVAATTFGQDDVELALEGGRLLQILR